MAPATTSPHSFSYLPLEGRSDPSEYLQRRPPLSSQKHAYRQTLKGGKKEIGDIVIWFFLSLLEINTIFNFLHLIISLSIQYYFQNVRFFFIAFSPYYLLHFENPCSILFLQNLMPFLIQDLYTIPPTSTYFVIQNFHTISFIFFLFLSKFQILFARFRSFFVSLFQPTLSVSI